MTTPAPHYHNPELVTPAPPQLPDEGSSRSDNSGGCAGASTINISPPPPAPTPGDLADDFAPGPLAPAPAPGALADDVAPGSGTGPVRDQLMHLIDIRGLKKKDLLRVAEEEWEKKAKMLGARVDRNMKQVLDMRNEIYQLVGFFSAFQGLLFTAVAQSSMLKCYNVWCPLALSVFASIITVSRVIQKSTTIQGLQGFINMEDPARKVHWSFSTPS